MPDVMNAGAPIQALQEKVYFRLKESIINCGMMPGSVISEERLALEFGTSRTPIREALLRLQRENLVVIFPRQGTFVSQISLKDIHEIYQIRLIIEPRVARSSGGNMDPAVLERFRNYFGIPDEGTGSFGTWFQHDRDFHSYIIDSCGNRHLSQMDASIMDQNQRMRILSGKIPQRIQDTNSEHVEIVDALLARNEDRIESLMTAHILASRNAALKIEDFLQA
jgi:DNA-binding GntR family transcriptional regulator